VKVTIVKCVKSNNPKDRYNVTINDRQVLVY